MKKVLFVATITRTINAFLIPYLKMFKENGYEVHVASNGNEQIEYCDKHYSTGVGKKQGWGYFIFTNDPRGNCGHSGRILRFLRKQGALSQGS